MHIARMDLTDFRNHAANGLSPGKGLVVLAGPNGAGKTNILEAISLLAPGRGLRAAPLSEMMRDGAQNGLAIAAHIASDDGELPNVMIGTAVHPDAPGRRRVRINGVDAAANSLAEWLSILWLTPAMDRIFVEAAGQRRRFLDRLTLALFPGHAHHSSRYEAAMRSRTRLLSADASADPHWLDALEAQMAEHGSAVDAARHRLIRHLTSALTVVPKTLFAIPGLSLIYPQEGAAQPWDEGRLWDALRHSRLRDAAAGRALTGPHRVDLGAIHAASQQPAARCSTGEQKALLLSIVLAHGDLVAAARGQRPILLLDELAAHLDPERRADLFARLAATGGQVWMTGTEMALFNAVPDGASRWEIVAGMPPQLR